MSTTEVEGRPGPDGWSAGGPDLQALNDEQLLALTRRAASGTVGMSPEDCLETIEALHLLSRRLEGLRLHATRELAARTGEELLARQDVADPAELSRTARDRWRARAKSVTATEISVLTGMGRGAARQLVAVALAPVSTSGPVRDALAAGVATWAQVEHFWRKASQLPHEQAGVVSRALFTTTRGEPGVPAQDPGPADDERAGDGVDDGPSTSPTDVAVERLDPEGNLTDMPWHAQQFVQAVQREVTRARATDPEAEAAERAQLHRARTAYGIVDDDGTGQVVITGDAVSTSACVDRLHVLARRARAAGDERTESQLRSDIARALLLHGTLPLPAALRSDPAGRPSKVPAPPAGLTFAAPADPAPRCSTTPDELADLVTPDDIASLAQILAGAPTCELQVVVPWPALAPELGSTDTAPETGSSGSPPTGSAPLPLLPGVSRVVGRAPHFLTPQATRDLLRTPGTTLHRLLTDPRDGRCVERSITRYRPDATMRTQVVAADLLSRAPDGTLPVRDGQLDHVTEYLLGGPTSEHNLQGVDTVFHALKTQTFWDAEIDATRTVTWTSLLGRRYRTRPHDYRQYLGYPHPETGTDASRRASTGTSTSQGMSGTVTPAERRHLASLLVYAALAQRPERGRLEAPDDDPDSDTHLLDDGHRAVWVRQTRQRDGRRVSGPRPGTPTPERLLRTPPGIVLRSAHWTDPFTRRDSGTQGPPPGAREDEDDAPPF
ncbi:hypothetical protein [Serinicoccus sediminis]|uniref:hypothetical protein n=1 Tax=Serinicoccus sediminis TaxID=2306021 RepID=UPI00101EFE44|nr:hypothetical protein [Serinicoccus sediminis]